MRIQRPHELNNLIWFRRGADLDPNRITDPGGKVYVRAIQLPGALADPQEMSGGSVHLSA